jgi:chitin synthase
MLKARYLRLNLSDKFVYSIWAIFDGGVYDLTDYINSLNINQGATALYSFLNTEIVDVFKQQAGQDITKQLTTVLEGLDPTVRKTNLDCLRVVFYVGGTDFRKTARCEAQNYVLLAFSILLVASMALKCTSKLCFPPAWFHAY